MRRTHCFGRAARYMKTTSKNDVWLQMTSAPSSLEGAQLVAVVHPVAEQQLAQAAHHHVGRVAEPVRDLVFAGLAAQIHVPHLGVNDKYFAQSCFL